MHVRLAPARRQLIALPRACCRRVRDRSRGGGRRPSRARNSSVRRVALAGDAARTRRPLPHGHVDVRAGSTRLAPAELVCRAAYARPHISPVGDRSLDEPGVSRAPGSAPCAAAPLCRSAPGPAPASCAPRPDARLRPASRARASQDLSRAAVPHVRERSRAEQQDALRLWQLRSAAAALAVSQHAERQAHISSRLAQAFTCIHHYEAPGTRTPATATTAACRWT